MLVVSTFLYAVLMQHLGTDLT